MRNFLRATAAFALVAVPAPPLYAQVRFDERVDVARVLVEVRVTDARGEPIRGLPADAFRLDLDGKPGRVESATWIGTPGGAVELAGHVPDPVAPPAFITRGRLIVFMFQQSLEPSRTVGLLRMMAESARFVDRLQAADRAAVVVFDSRLRIWQDFTANAAILKEVLGSRVMLRSPADAGPDDVSLAAVLDRKQAAHAGTPEAALGVLAVALRQIEGPKSVVVFGHGFGAFRPVPGSLTGRAVLGSEYEQARTALIAARATVFAMDVTDADGHTLAKGLMATAEDTGGFYVKAHEFEAAAMDRLGGALEGYYLLAVEARGANVGRHSIRVRVAAPGGTVFSRRYYGG